MAEIVITLQTTQVPGQIAPKVDLLDVPGGWETAVDVLLIATRMAYKEHLKATKGEQRRVVLADAMPAMPGNGERH